MQIVNHSKLVCIVALCFAASIANAQDSGLTLTPAEMQWKPGRVPGTEIADVIGDASKPGPYVQRVKFPPNFTNKPHTHPEERHYTVISGTWYMGWGTKLDESTLKTLPAGSFYTEPANVPHFVLTKGEPVIIQITGIGPTATRFIDAAPAP